MHELAPYFPLAHAVTILEACPHLTWVAVLTALPLGLLAGYWQRKHLVRAAVTVLIVWSVAFLGYTTGVRKYIRSKPQFYWCLKALESAQYEWEHKYDPRKRDGPTESQSFEPPILGSSREPDADDQLVLRERQDECAYLVSHIDRRIAKIRSELEKHRLAIEESRNRGVSNDVVTVHMVEFRVAQAKLDEARDLRDVLALRISQLGISAHVGSAVEK